MFFAERTEQRSVFGSTRAVTKIALAKGFAVAIGKEGVDLSNMREKVVALTVALAPLAIGGKPPMSRLTASRTRSLDASQLGHPFHRPRHRAALGHAGRLNRP